MRKTKRTEKGVLLARSVAAGSLLAGAGCGAEATEAGDPASAGSGAAAAPAAFQPPSPSPEDEQAMNLRATVEVPERAIVKFYEPQEGMIVVTEAGRTERLRSSPGT